MVNVHSIIILGRGLRMDAIDATDRSEEFIIAAKIASRPRYVGVSAKRCVECDEPIPHGRREAVPGVKLCVECAE